jgi:hypothetical protein
MSTAHILERMEALHMEHMRGLRHIAKEQTRLAEMLAARNNHPLRRFLSAVWKAFKDKLATNLGHWLAGLPLWLLALEVLGLRELLAKLLG